MAEILPRLIEAVRDELAGAVELRHRLHAHPELSNQELHTRELLAEALGDWGRRVAGSGLLLRVGAVAGPAVAVRAEMDGLPIAEATRASFAATTGVMHACGHDVHMAALVALVRAVRAVEAELPVPLVAVFQPSEETHPSGAERIVAEGALAEGGVRAVAAVHVHPTVPWRTVAVDEGPVNASLDYLRVVVEGAGGHAAYPHAARDPVLALSQVVVSLQQVVSRRMDPMTDAALTLGWLRAGSADNVIPDRAEAGGTLRVLQPDARAPLLKAAREVVEHTARAHGCTARVEVIRGEPAVVNDAVLVRASRAMLHRAGLRPAAEMRSCGSDDFGYLAAAAPSLMMFLGLRGAIGDLGRPLHHPQFLPPDEAVGAVAQAQAAAYVAAAQRDSWPERHDPSSAGHSEAVDGA
jgi:amidohydrolase